MELGAEDRAADLAVHGLETQVTDTEVMLGNMHVDTLNEARTAGVLSLIEGMESGGGSMLSSWALLARENASLQRQGGGAGGGGQGGQGGSRRAGGGESDAHTPAGQSPFHFQATHLPLLEQECQRQSVVRVGMPDRDTWGKPVKPWAPLRDVPDLACGNEGGMRSLRAFRCDASSACDPSVPVRVVAMPRTAQPELFERAHNVYAAHRELLLSRRFLSPLGQGESTGTHMPPTVGKGNENIESALLFYEHVRLRPVRALLRGGALPEDGPLFAFLVHEIMCALRDISQQSTHMLYDPHLTIDLGCVFLAGEAGMRVVLEGLKWGPALAASDPSASSMLASRDRSLVAAMGGMLRELAAATATSVEARVRAGRAVWNAEEERFWTVFPRSLLVAPDALLPEPPLRVQLGDAFALQLPSDTGSNGFVWDTPVVVRVPSADGSIARGPLPVRACGVASGGFLGDPRALFVKLDAVIAGSCQVMLYCRWPWEALPPQPTLSIDICVVASAVSPKLASAIDLCSSSSSLPPSSSSLGGSASSGSASGGSGVVTLEDISHHPIFAFQERFVLDDVALDVERLVS